MTLAEIQELLGKVQIHKVGFPNSFLVKNMTERQLLEIFLLAQSQLCELESRAPTPTDNPS